MDAKTISIPGKIIISGEYAVVFGEPGLAIPSTPSLTFNYTPHNDPLSIYIDHPQASVEWQAYGLELIKQLATLGTIITTGTLTISGNLPLGRGMGSSTAVVIGITRILGGTDQMALSLEDTVNPGHSGLDFAVISQHRPVLFKKNQPPQAMEISLHWLEQSVLIDTGAPDQTTPELVAWIRSRADELYPHLQEIALCTELLAKGESPLIIFPRHHRAQCAVGVVPKSVQDFIAEIEHAGGVAKVIGAGGRTGGGGMVLALHNNTSALMPLIQRYQFTTII
jgi:mevalonate kinase